MITYPLGFRAAGVTAGLKASGRPDLALVVNDGPHHTAAGVFTTNRVVAWPVTWTKSAIEDGTIRAVVLNSGNANVATPGGMAVTEATAQQAADSLGIDVHDVAICSTGVIGTALTAEPLVTGVISAVPALSEDGGSAAAEAIMTTDTKRKEAQFAAGFRIGGMAKGAGMIAPGMATMLCVITTDAVLDPTSAQDALAVAVDLTFNRIDVDGCMSTNDTVLLLASGASGIAPDPDEFQAGLRAVCGDLARQIIADAEGASHDIDLRVTKSATAAGALAVARAIAQSNLFKCAIFGNDPNWGRIISAAGTVPEAVAPFDPADLAVIINGVPVAQNGVDTGRRDEVDMAAQRDVIIELQLGSGEESAQIWTNDLTYDYVTENSAYTT
ncbi:bifunctional glutamate N-acetyltransferase/amino-acid acetyltransferase ArgJ [Flaviflexus salsibiostraticola]|uniref:bifunctional glutamate N-acetyltransferase/amino-acid acetyltransferase ArgJ n=1 Tax=Flaviflexus salsibiostraticola TaxID=1282737 RepID=UPI0013DE228B|nr:bifunctional glutamate N-acetyltransferase/amino-acid acetyltransferase ArgJ [Flaviflexus salsibiostraticola]